MDEGRTMKLSLLEKDRIRLIIRKLIVGDKDWFVEYGIIVGDKGQYWILNYQQGTRNEINHLVRGMVVEKPQADFDSDPLVLIKSFPFSRFFNSGEAEAAPIDFARAEMLEKMDGSMIGVFFPNGTTNPEFHTRKMISTHKEDMERNLTTFYGKEYKFLSVIQEYVNTLTFGDEDKIYTFVFEFIHDSSCVITRYTPEQYGLYLLGARNLVNHDELSEDELDQVAQRIGANRPRRFAAVADHAEIENMFALIGADTPNFEGFVFRDKISGHRVKVKDLSYVQKHHMLDNQRYKYLIPIILKGEEEEIIAYFPSVKDRVEEFKKFYNNYIDHVAERVLFWKQKGLTGRDLSVTLFGENPLPKWELRLLKMRGQQRQKSVPAEPDEFIRSSILKYSTLSQDKIREGVESDLRAIGIGLGTNVGNPKKLIGLIGLHDDEETFAGEVEP